MEVAESPAQDFSADGKIIASQAKNSGQGLDSGPRRPPKITLVYFDAGGGHRTTMNALCAMFRTQQKPWEIESFNLQEYLDALDPIRKLTGLRIQDTYNLMLKKGWTLGAPQLLVVLHGLIRLYHSRIVSHLESHWRASQPDMVVSLIPNFNRQLVASLRKVSANAPFVTLITDLADYPPHLWIERESQYVICGTEHAAEQALLAGHASHRVFRTSGMVVSPAFYSSPVEDRRREIEQLGLDPVRKTGLVLFGGQGSSAMLEIARRLKSFPGLQLIFVCGKNLALAEKLRGMDFDIPVIVEGFTTRIPYYMGLSDFFIGKPGPGSISEALVMGLPVIVERNAWTLPQERFNAEWIQSKGVGYVVRSLRHVDKAVEQLLEPATFANCARNALALRNRAVYEVPRILEGLLAKTGAKVSMGRP